MRPPYPFFAAVLGLALIAGGAPAGAAPQALGLLATNAPVPLTCFAGRCEASLAAFCLQQARDVPAPGTRYRIAGDGVVLIAVGADGRATRVAAADQLEVRVERGYTSVRIGLAQPALAALGAVRAAVEVGPEVTLLPVPVAGDPNPQTAADIAAATGPLRALGAAVVDDGGAESTGARLTGALINRLPAFDRVAPATAQTLWAETVAASAPADGGPIDTALAERTFARCQAAVAEGRFYSLRRCLERAQDAFMLRLNARFWQLLVGS